jgi:hypothetical protein
VRLAACATLLALGPAIAAARAQDAGAARPPNVLLILAADLGFGDRGLQKLRLYDLSTDPFEVWDLAAVEPERVAVLRAELATIRASVDSDPLRPRR